MRNRHLHRHKKTHVLAWVCLPPSQAPGVVSSYLAAFHCGAKALVEALYAAAGGRLLLLAGVERMAVGAYVQREVAAGRGTDGKVLAAGAGGGDRVVFRVDTLFHLEPHKAVCRHLITCQAPHTG